MMEDVRRWRVARMLGVLHANLDKEIKCTKEQEELLREWTSVAEVSKSLMDRILVQKIREDYPIQTKCETVRVE